MNCCLHSYKHMSVLFIFKLCFVSIASNISFRSVFQDIVSIDTVIMKIMVSS